MLCISTKWIGWVKVTVRGGHRRIGPNGLVAPLHLLDVFVISAAGLGQLRLRDLGRCDIPLANLH
jgi:hypothetical protein